jgi:hypothetical protein
MDKNKCPKTTFGKYILEKIFCETINFFKVRETMQSFQVYEHNFLNILLFFAEKNLGIFPVVNI